MGIPVKAIQAGGTAAQKGSSILVTPMHPLVDELIDYLDAGQVAPKLVAADEALGRVGLRSIVSKLVNWMKYQVRPPLGLRPMRLEAYHKWVKPLRSLPDLVRGFSEVFQIRGDRLDFIDSMPLDERQRIVAHVDERHNPPLHGLYGSWGVFFEKAGDMHTVTAVHRSGIMIERKGTDPERVFRECEAAAGGFDWPDLSEFDED